MAKSRFTTWFKPNEPPVVSGVFQREMEDGQRVYNYFDPTGTDGWFTSGHNAKAALEQYNRFKTPSAHQKKGFVWRGCTDAKG
jgi:hypothetical protein